MRRHRMDTVHPLGCTCRACAPRACRDHRIDMAIKGATRALFLIAAIMMIPFIIAHALASAKGESR
ncbi:hypothetical protein [Novosphingobium guangzhouense]|uniref:Uncharacterized protein n=1 Tax=Novosphingobium guangzhouense TaxID=1850347 RepID=A0A2K2FZQ6_9SPHN|nr:hypothetical protein [Novosphingobium guangzhouense]PNU04289.1 hypothetical protein A8V01_21200 [Novosphingobium guangzhouense]